MVYLSTSFHRCLPLPHHSPYPLLTQCDRCLEDCVGAHGWVAGIASYGSVIPSRGQLVTVEAPGYPRHPSSIQHDAVVKGLLSVAGHSTLLSLPATAVKKALKMTHNLKFENDQRATANSGYLEVMTQGCALRFIIGSPKGVQL